jgi:hypothetical protein
MGMKERSVNTATNKPKPTLETAVRVLEEAGFRVFDTTYRPKAVCGQTMLETLENGGGVISLSIMPCTELEEKTFTWVRL